MPDADVSLTFDRLPRTIPLFPLVGVLLLPGGRLPLNIFEPRYLEMTREAMAGPRLIGMIQPRDPNDSAAGPILYRAGCVGHIISFSETDDNRYLIVLNGLCRFSIVEELAATKPYRQALVSFGRYRGDMEDDDPSGVDWRRLLFGLRAYLETKEIKVDWKAVGPQPGREVISALAMICPFGPSEKQALLEAGNFVERCRVLTALAEMALVEHSSNSATPIQ